MKKAILATKVGMTQIFNENGVLTPVTVLQAGPCYVTQVKTVDNDGYSAVQVGFVEDVYKRQKYHRDQPLWRHICLQAQHYLRGIAPLQIHAAMLGCGCMYVAGIRTKDRCV